VLLFSSELYHLVSLPDFLCKPYEVKDYDAVYAACLRNFTALRFALSRLPLVRSPLLKPDLTMSSVRKIRYAVPDGGRLVD
jgi:hypothetical protein